MATDFKRALRQRVMLGIATGHINPDTARSVLAEFDVRLPESRPGAGGGNPARSQQQRDTTLHEIERREQELALKRAEAEIDVAQAREQARLSHADKFMEMLKKNHSSALDRKSREAQAMARRQDGTVQ